VRRETQERILALPGWANAAEVLDAALKLSFHDLRSKVLWWVLVPVVVVPVLTCLSLIVCDAVGYIKPMRDSLLTAVAGITGGGVVSTAVSAGFGWLYKVDSDSDSSE